MPALVFSAMRARRTQTVAVFVLTLLAALAMSVVPWYLTWARAAVVATDVAATPVAARVVQVAGTAAYQPGQPSPLPALRTEVEQYVDVAGSAVTTGADIAGSLGASVAAKTTENLVMAARDQVCDQIIIDGTCPSGRDEVVVGRETAQHLHLTVGGSAVFTSLEVLRPVTLRVTGVYDPRDPTAAYWTGTNLLGGQDGGLGEAAFVTMDTLLALVPQGITVDYHAVLPASAFRDGGVAVARQVRRAQDELTTNRFVVSSSASDLAGAIAADRGEVRDGVLVAAVELVLLSWLVLFLAVRQASVSRRAEIGLLKLRGGPRWQLWAVAGQESVWPMLAGVVAGTGLAYLAAAGLARSRAAMHPPDLGTTFVQAAAVAGLVGLGALVVAVAAEMSAVRSPVLSLLRRVPGRRSRWRAPVADLAVVALALAGVYQGHAEQDPGGAPSPLALATPALIGLAIALVLARALPLLAAWFGARGLATARPGAALGALHVARRPGTERVFLVVAVAVSVAVTTAFYAATALSAWDARAGLELGADRVLTVQAQNSTALLADVRAADPAGRYAMAVAYSAATRTLAVDTTRLAAVARLSRDYGLPDAATLARELRPAAPAPVVLRDGPVEVDVGLEAGTGTGAATLTLAYADAAGQVRDARFGPLASGRRGYEATVSGCAGGCRLVSLAPSTVAGTATVSVYSIAQAGGGATGAEMGDVRLWHSQVGPGSTGPLIATTGGGLAITVSGGPPPDGTYLDDGVYFASAPLPLPVAIAGGEPAQDQPGDPRVTALGAVRVPYQVVASGRALPRAGTTGVLMDLAAAQGVLGLAHESVTLEVWLTADTPASVLAALRARGVDVLSDASAGTRAGGLADHGTGLALRFRLLAALVVLLLAAGSLAVTAGVERHDRAAELRTLRTQGLAAGQARLAGYAATLIVVLGAVLTGVVAALVAGEVTASRLSVFADGWSDLPLPGGISPAALGTAVLVAVAVLVPVAILGVARMLRTAGRES